jgi:hypothetical protein
MEVAMRNKTKARFEELLERAMDARTIWLHAQRDYLPEHCATSYEAYFEAMNELLDFTVRKPKCREIVNIVFARK